MKNESLRVRTRRRACLGVVGDGGLGLLERRGGVLCSGQTLHDVSKLDPSRRSFLKESGELPLSLSKIKSLVFEHHMRERENIITSDLSIAVINTHGRVLGLMEDATRSGSRMKVLDYGVTRTHSNSEKTPARGDEAEVSRRMRRQQ